MCFAYRANRSKVCEPQVSRLSFPSCSRNFGSWWIDNWETEEEVGRIHEQNRSSWYCQSSASIRPGYFTPGQSLGIPWLRGFRAGNCDQWVANVIPWSQRFFTKRRRNPLVTVVLNLTSMQLTAVKYVNYTINQSPRCYHDSSNQERGSDSGAT